MTDWIKGLAGAAMGSDTNMELLVQYTGVPRQDVLAAHFASLDFLRPAHYVAIDRRVGAVVIAVRGTMSLTDTLTDIAATPGVLQVRVCVYVCGACSCCVYDALFARNHSVSLLMSPFCVSCRMGTDTVGWWRRRGSWRASTHRCCAKSWQYVCLSVCSGATINFLIRFLLEKPGDHACNYDGPFAGAGTASLLAAAA